MLKTVAGLAIALIFLGVAYRQYRKTKSGACCSTGPGGRDGGKPSC